MEKQRVITIRVPASLHEAVRVLAYANLTSVNRTCVRLLRSAVPAHAAANLALRREEGRAE